MLTILNWPRLSFRRYGSVLMIVLLLAGSGTTVSQEITVKVVDSGRTFIGKPLAWDGQKLMLLRRDGRLSYLPAQSKDDVSQIADDFQPITTDQLRQRLKRQFGTRYDVSTTKHFVIVHPWGDSNYWSLPFEELHSQFFDFFESHGVELQEPRFPLVAVVMRSRSDFDRYLSNDERMTDQRVQGYYSRRTNQMVTFDPEQKLRDKEKPNWLYTSSTIIHEATHQSAFNSGVHNRIAPPPKWLSEGLAMLFEARGVHHSRRYKKFQDRINRTRLQALRRYYQTEPDIGGLQQIISDDRLFLSHPEYAYGMAWGITFFLVETQPEAYFNHLRKDTSRKTFAAYPSTQRLKDFATSFGTDVNQLEVDMKNYFFGNRD